VSAFFWRVLILCLSGSRSATLYRFCLTLAALPSRQSLRRWQRRLGLADYAGSLEATHPDQVTGPDERQGVELVGVAVTGRRFRLIHTRPLAADDIVHELLHVAWPDASHDTIERWTDRLIAQPSLTSYVATSGPILTMSHRSSGIPSQPQQQKEDYPMATEWKAFNLKTKQSCTILNPQIVTLKNGRKAVRGIASDDGATPVVRILSAKAVQELSG
jgi:hypothetical protein